MIKKRIFLDLERTRRPLSGLSNVCNMLLKGIINKTFKTFNFYFFVSKNIAENYPLNKDVISYKKIHFIYNKYIHKSDIVHLTWQLSSTRKMLKNYNKKLIYTIHDINILYENGYENSKKSLDIIKEIAKRSDIVTTISEFVKSELIKHLGINENKIITIHNGVELNRYPYFDSPRYKPENKFLFFIGEIRKKKNLHTLLHLLINTDYKLILSGNTDDTDYLNFLLNEAKVINVSDKLVITGSISEEEKFWYYNNCEAFLFPSLFEGFGIPPIEAMSLGKPVFLSKCTSLPEIGGDSAYYFDDFTPESMIKTFKNGMNDFNKNKKEKTIELINHSKKFSPENSVNKYLDLYKNICDL